MRRTLADTSSASDAATPSSRIDYVEQRLADLVLYLLEAPAPRAAVRILSERRIGLQAGQLTLAVIGSSHFLEITSGNTILCELLACSRPQLVAAAGSGEKIGQRLKRYHLARGSVAYSVDVWSRKLSAREFAGETALLLAEGSNRLLYSFPAGTGLGHAVTCLEWQVKGSRATVATYHSFPGELTIVHTRSVIDIADAGALR